MARRVLQQFRRDRRTLALLFVVPVVILSLLGYLLRGAGSEVKVGVVGDGPFASALLNSTTVNASSLSSAEADRELRAGTLAGYIVVGSGLPAIYLEGSQPSVNQAVISAVIAAAGGPRPQVHYLYGGPSLDTLDYFGAGFIGLVVFFLVFVVTSVAFLRERWAARWSG